MYCKCPITPVKFKTHQNKIAGQNDQLRMVTINPTKFDLNPFSGSVIFFNSQSPITPIKKSKTKWCCNMINCIMFLTTILQNLKEIRPVVAEEFCSQNLPIVSMYKITA